MTFDRPDPAKLDELLALLERESNVVDIKPFLRSAKELDKRIRISGPKSGLVDQLREAVNLGLLPFDDLRRLLLEIEESSRQIVYLYRPMTASGLARCRDGNLIASELFGAGWRQSRKFPIFHLTPEGTHWSDFRPNDNGLGSTGWVGKIYAGLERWKTVRRVVSPDGLDETIYRHKEVVRESYTIQWRKGFLELRVPFADSQSQRDESLLGVWNMLGAALKRGEDVFDVDLEAACHRINQIASTKLGRVQFTLPAIKFDDPDLGGGSFYTASEDENLMDRAEVRELIPRYGGCKQSSPTWHLPEEIAGDSLSLPTNIGGFGRNAIYFKLPSSYKAVHHVIDRLRGFTEETPDA